MVPLIFQSLLHNILPGLICTWSDMYEICAKTFLEETFMRSPILYVYAWEHWYAIFRVLCMLILYFYLAHAQEEFHRTHADLFYSF